MLIVAVGFRGKICCLRDVTAFRHGTPFGRLGPWWHARGITWQGFARDDPHAILGITPTAAADEVKAAYRRAALRTHPDRDGGSELAFKRVAAAYHSLSGDADHPHSRNGSSSYWNGATKYTGVYHQYAYDRYSPLETVSSSEAEHLFRRVFGGRSVEEVLQEEAARNANGAKVDNGFFEECVRQANFNKLLLEAQVRAEAMKLAGADEKKVIVSRERVTTEDGRSFVKVKTTTYWQDGRSHSDVTMKPRYKM